MKNKIQWLIGLTVVLATQYSQAQQVDEQRMNRDIKVAENVLATLIRQKFESNRMFFPLSVAGTYQTGQGVTFVLPADYTTPILFGLPDNDGIFQDAYGVSSGSRTLTTQGAEPREQNREWKLRDRKQANLDSLRDISNNRLIEAAKEFLADYGDILSQVRENEKIVITNHGSQPRMWVSQLMSAPNRTHISIELSRADLGNFKQGKINREQLLAKIKVVNALAVDDVEPDLELLATIFSRLYRQDLSETFFTEGNIYYERLKDYGAVYYMQVFSANRTFRGNYDMPTVGLREIGQPERDAKIKELYPVFEEELMENVIEYGRTIKSLGDSELLVFNIRLTQCPGCGIPSTLEISVKGAVLKDYNAGKISKQAARDKLGVKKGAGQ